MTWRAPITRDGLLAFILLGVTGIAALSVHVVLQQVLDVPFPQVASVPVYAKLLRPVSGTLALMALGAGAMIAAKLLKRGASGVVRPRK